MAMEISPVLRMLQPEARPAPRPAQESPKPRVEKAPAPSEQIQRYLAELQHVSSVFNRRLSFSYHEALGQVVVKVIDRQTDKVIKELPPEELQRVHLRIREAIGLLLDETI
jgi:flagellar protein FlaG